MRPRRVITPIGTLTDFIHVRLHLRLTLNRCSYTDNRTARMAATLVNEKNMGSQVRLDQALADAMVREVTDELIPGVWAVMKHGL